MKEPRRILSLGRKALPVVILATLAGCAGAVPWNPQNNAGITNVRIAFEDGKISDVRWVDGKEKARVRLNVDLASKTLSYSANDVLAFPAFNSRAEVEKWVAEQFAGASKEIMPKIVDLIAKASGL